MSGRPCIGPGRGNRSCGKELGGHLGGKATGCTTSPPTRRPGKRSWMRPKTEAARFCGTPSGRAMPKPSMKTCAWGTRRWNCSPTRSMTTPRSQPIWIWKNPVSGSSGTG
ncbi:MAG: hypothetical protein ACE5R6_11025 [Candidatus Heimdallarchaeota archaeon]